MKKKQCDRLRDTVHSLEISERVDECCSGWDSKWVTYKDAKHIKIDFE